MASPQLGSWGAGSQRSWCSDCLSRGAQGSQEEAPDQPLVQCGGAVGRDLPRSLETRLARTTCTPGVPGAPFQKRLVRPVPSEPGSDEGLPGSSSHLSPGHPLRGGALAPGPIETAAPPGRRDIRPSLGTEKGLCTSPGTVAPPRSPHRGSLFPCRTSPGRPDALCPLQPAWPRSGPYQTGRRARNSPRPDWLIFNSRALSNSPIGLSFPSSTFDWPSWGRSMASTTDLVLYRRLELTSFQDIIKTVWMSPGRV